MSKPLSRYGKGMYIKSKTFTNRTTNEDFTVLKLGIRKDEFLENPFNDNGWSNFEIRFNNKNEPYIVVDSQYNNILSTVKPDATAQEIIDNDGNDEIPF